MPDQLERDKETCIELLRAHPETWDEGPDELFVECLESLDDLRASDIVNMCAAAPELAKIMDISLPAARAIHTYWIKTYPRDST